VAEAFLCVSWVIGPSQTGEGIVVVVPRPLLLGPLRSSTQARSLQGFLLPSLFFI